MAALYRSYVFKTKDPAIDELRTVIEDHFGRRITKKGSRRYSSGRRWAEARWHNERLVLPERRNVPAERDA